MGGNPKRTFGPSLSTELLARRDNGFTFALYALFEHCDVAATLDALNANGTSPTTLEAKLKPVLRLTVAIANGLKK